MKHTRLRISALSAFWLGNLAALSGCASSPPVEYFTLEPMEALAATAPTLTGKVQVAQVHIPPSLDRKQMVRHSGAYTLDISDQHRWSAPLDEMIRRVLTQDLMQVLPRNSVVLANEPAPPGTRKIVVNILEFAPGRSGTVQFEGTWSVIVADSSAPGQSLDLKYSEPADAKDPVDQVKGMSRILGRAAISMAQALAAPPVP